MGRPTPIPDNNDDDLTGVDPDWEDVPRSPIALIPIPDEPSNIPDAVGTGVLQVSKRHVENGETDAQALWNETAYNPLSRRYTVCAVTYDNTRYPSTASVANVLANTVPAGAADNILAITKWIDYDLNQGQGQACTWSLRRFPARKNAQQEYASKHGPDKKNRESDI